MGAQLPPLDLRGLAWVLHGFQWHSMGQTVYSEARVGWNGGVNIPVIRGFRACAGLWIRMWEEFFVRLPAPRPAKRRLGEARTSMRRGARTGLGGSGCDGLLRLIRTTRGDAEFG